MNELWVCMRVLFVQNDSAVTFNSDDYVFEASALLKCIALLMKLIMGLFKGVDAL